MARKDVLELARAEMLRDDPDFPTAYKNVRAAIKQGNKEALYALGTWYLHGIDGHIEKDGKKAVELIKEAAEHGVPDACFDLAVSLETGKDIKADPKKALVYFIKAALLGSNESIEEVGRHFYYGIGAAKNRDVAYAFLDIYDEFEIKVEVQRKKRTRDPSE